MERTRRGALRLAGVSVATLAAGCLDETDSAAGSPTDQPSETPTDQPTGTPADPPTDGQLPADLDRVDEPPYEVTVPECGEIGPDDGDRDPLYLCANMASEPSIPFTQSTTRGQVLETHGVAGSADHEREAMFVVLLDRAADRDRVPEDASSDAADLIRDTDFDSHAVLVVETGWGSGSVYPHLKRVEATDTGVHAFGCHSDPCIVTSDLTTRTTVVRFERPDALETGWSV